MSDAKIINFMGQRKLAAFLSIALVLASIASLAFRGLNLGLDFLGGTQVEVTYSSPADLDKARSSITEAGFRDATVVYFGAETEVMIRFHGTLEDVALEGISSRLNTLIPGATINEIEKRTQGYEVKLALSDANNLKQVVGELFPSKFFDAVEVKQEEGVTNVYFSKTFGDAMTAMLVDTLAQAAAQEVTLNYSESVDSQVGAEMFENAMMGMLVSLLIVMIYVAFRFQYKFSFGAVAALIHDVIITLGVFSFFHFDFDLTVFAAILAVIGYSLNDTIVVSDRIRENFRKIRQMEPMDIINTSLTQTLGRTLVTSLTTLLVLGALFIFGGEAISGFALALIVGIVVGTYSSIYVSANTLVALHIQKEDMIVPVKEGAEFEEIP
ncbi:hypothetical protein NBRC116494_11380 [Aurantivibrio plasticivorans]